MSKKPNTTILINGRRYDAVTGIPIRVVSEVVEKTTTKSATSIDGVFGGGHAAKKVQPAIHAPKTRAKAPNNKHHTPKQSATLVRRTVTKPERSISTTTVIKAERTIVTPVAHKMAAHRVHTSRQQRAATIPMSKKVQRYTKNTKLTSPWLQQVTQTINSLDNAIQTPQTAPQPSKKVYRADITPNSRVTHDDIFEKALQRATAHHEPAPALPKKSLGRTQRYMIRITASTLTFLLLAGVVSFAAADTITYRLAAHRAGFNAQMPSYQLNGFQVSSVNGATGNFSVDYNGISGTYKVTQKPSSWNSQALLDHIQSSGSQTLGSLQAAGRTVYLYGKNQAAWVSNGVLYQIFGNGVLNTRDFLNIAASI